MNLLKSNLLAATLLCFVLTSCSKEDAAEIENAKYEIDLGLVHENDSEMSERILELENIHRASIGVSPLQMETTYATALAVKHTKYMIEVENINHDNFGFRSEAIKYHDHAQIVAENVAYGYSDAEGVINAWLNSPGHRAMIEGDFTHTGFGIKKCSDGQMYYTQLFYKK